MKSTELIVIFNALVHDGNAFKINDFQRPDQSGLKASMELMCYNVFKTFSMQALL